MPQNNDPQFCDEEQSTNREPKSGAEGQAAGTQRQPDSNPGQASGGQDRHADEEWTGGQKDQPGLPEANDEEWSPGSDVPTI